MLTRLQRLTDWKLRQGRKVWLARIVGDRLNEIKAARLRRTVEIAQALAALREPAVVKWFNATEDNHIDSVLSAKDDGERREAAAMARAFRELKSFVYGTLEAGDRAVAELDRIKV